MYGSIISWSGTDQVGALGVLYVVFGLILVSGRVIGDQDGGADAFDASICAPNGCLPTVSAPNTIVSASAARPSRHKTCGKI
ncbi:hypothetical protein B0H14DRAFT_3456097 [Mycena olivaceomarginata]|nr:hypothetical protein B0H14DRAFT_3456097 [Mycena olivaceomarginata]